MRPRLKRIFMSLVFLLTFPVSTLLSAGSTDIAGYIDRVFERNGMTVIAGWACAKGFAGNISLHTYVGGPAGGGGQYVSSATTHLPHESAVANICRTTGAGSAVKHRFEVMINASSSAYRNKAIYIHGISPYGLPNLTISNSGHFKVPDSPLNKLRSAKRIFWIGAHPDDELIVSPVLGEVCKRSTATCTFIVASSGSHGICDYRNPKCRDIPAASQRTPAQFAAVGSIRMEEMINAAKFITGRSNMQVDEYGTYVKQGELSNGLSPDRNTIKIHWDNQLRAATGLSVKDYIKQQIRELRPDVILTFDPRHGTTCHPEHRVIGQEVYNAVLESAAYISQDQAYVVTSKAVIDGGEVRGLTPVNANDPTSWTYDAHGSRHSYFGSGNTGWDYLLKVIGKHPSQFTAGNIQKINSAPVSERTVNLQSMRDYRNSSDPSYSQVCN